MSMRVALFTENSMVGGSELVFAALCRGLSERGLEVHAISPGGVVAEFLTAELEGHAAVHTISRIREADASIRQQVTRLAHPWNEVRRTVARISPDVFHINNGGYPASDPCRLATLATRVPTVMTIHASPTARNNHNPTLHRLADRAVWRSLDAVISATQAVVGQLQDLRGMPSGKARIVRYGVEPAQVAPNVVAELRESLAPSGEMLVGMVCSAGSQAVWKGYPVIGEALARMTRDDLRLVLVGHDPGPDIWDHVGKARDRVTYAGRVDDVREYMAAFDLLAIPSTRYESLPLVLLESFSVGTPVAGSRLSGIPEAITDGENGFLFEPGAAGELAALFDRVAADRTPLGAMGEAAKARYDSDFTYGLMIDRTLTVYQEIAR